MCGSMPITSKYQNKRPDYIEAYWNVVDWKAADANFGAAK